MPCRGQVGAPHLGSLQRGGSGADAALIVQLPPSLPTELLGCEELHDLVRLVLKTGNYMNEVPPGGSSWGGSASWPGLSGAQLPHHTRVPGGRVGSLKRSSWLVPCGGGASRWPPESAAASGQPCQAS